jgi:membrane-bound lytic murein transglycosylase D
MIAMTYLTWANLYICANVLLLLVAGLLAAVDKVGGKLRRPVAYGHRLAIGHALLVAAVLLPLATLVSGEDDVLPRTAQVWSGPTMRSGAADAPADHRIAVPFAPPGASLSLAAASEAAAGLVLLGLLVSLVRLGLDIRATMRIIARAQTIRRRGRLSIRASEQIQVPFSFWWPARCVIVVPSALVLHAEDLETAIRHEAQHHRQQDTKWLYLYQLMKALFFWNPAAHRLERHLRSLQEFACDEALSARRPALRADYCRSLLRVAEAAVLPRRGLIRAGMIDGGGRFLLKRRIEAVLRRPADHQRKLAVSAAGVVALSALAVTALAFGATIQDRRVSSEDAARMATVARESSAIPIAVGERVLRQLNLLLATPDGRAHLQASLDRMQAYEALLSAELARHGLPAELLAVPLVESGFRNFKPDGDPRHGAGLWMFIEPTARRFGLTVEAGRDERLDVAAETRAAAQLFAELYSRFGDWGLAILAFNAGAARVEEGIRATGSRDVWEIVERGFQNDPDYVARVMAVVLIMKNPSVLS